MIMSGGNGDESSGDELVCYCFGYTRKDIQRDWWNHNGMSTILEAIVAAKRAGGCDCARKNPQGR